MTKPREIFNPDENINIIRAKARAGGKASAEKRRGIARRKQQYEEVSEILDQRHKDTLLQGAIENEASLTKDIPESDR